MVVQTKFAALHSLVLQLAEQFPVPSTVEETFEVSMVVQTKFAALHSPVLQLVEQVPVPSAVEETFEPSIVIQLDEPLL